MLPALGGARRIVAGRSIRWNEARAQAAYRDGWWIRETLADRLVQIARDDPERTLVKDGDVLVTAARLHTRASCLARYFAARMPGGSVVSIMLPNWHEAAEIYFGATLAGMVVNLVLPSLRDHDLSFIVRDAASRMIFVPGEFRRHDYPAMLARVAGGMADPPDVVVLRGASGAHLAYDALFATMPPNRGPPALVTPILDPDAVRLIMYTSGTTGVPKGVMHTHNSLHALIRQLRRHWLVDPGDRFLVPSPISHIGGSIYAFEMPLLLGTTAVLMDEWNADRAVRLFERERITHMAGATPFLEQLLAAARAAATTLPQLKVFICGGAAVSPALIRETADYFANAAVTRVFGSTEVPLTTVGVTDREDIGHAAETDGRPAITDVRLRSDGEIRMRGPQMLVGYIRPEHEAAAFDEDGFFRSGDQGRWVDDEFLVVTGRIKDIIIRHGENIAPKEIEDLLAGHPAIVEVAIVGLPDPRTGERACAVVVPSPGAAIDLPTIALFLDARGVARFKIPEQIEIWDAVPKNDAGKVLKNRIRAILTGS